MTPQILMALLLGFFLIYSAAVWAILKVREKQKLNKIRAATVQEVNNMEEYEDA